MTNGKTNVTRSIRMTKPLAVVGYIGTNTNLLEATSLIATELAAMARVLERCGYEANSAT